MFHPLNLPSVKHNPTYTHVLHYVVSEKFPVFLNYSSKLQEPYSQSYLHKI